MEDSAEPVSTTRTWNESRARAESFEATTTGALATGSSTRRRKERVAGAADSSRVRFLTDDLGCGRRQGCASPVTRYRPGQHTASVDACVEKAAAVPRPIDCVPTHGIDLRSL